MNKHTSTRIFINSINMQSECIYIQGVRERRVTLFILFHT
nr:MAG TPA: hypothetical protein [Caudoviricetes sp.]